MMGEEKELEWKSLYCTNVVVTCPVSTLCRQQWNSSKIDLNWKVKLFFNVLLKILERDIIIY